ncbi:hypothetical protein HD554DRAFT_2169335 [Boletus coccyginus]|nr:hypothetical protein HD554DRAFT_2169335 [Boletus coccyginus]
MEPSTSNSQLTTRDGDACLSCTAIHRILKPGDRFPCYTCDNVAIGVTPTHADSPPAECTNENNKHRPNVWDIFNQVTGKSATQRLAIGSTQVARAGYQELGRGPTPQAVGNIRKGHTRASNIAARPSRSSSRPPGSTSGSHGKQFRVSKLGMLVCGVDVMFFVTLKHGALRAMKLPIRPNASQVELQKMKNRGCYLDDVTMVDSTWTYEQTSAKLAEWFPPVFQYVHDHGLNQQRAGTGDILPWWRLLVKSGFSLSVVEAVYLTGADLLQNKGRDKAGVTDSQLWFVTRNRIPDEVYESWNSQQLVAGSDSAEEQSTEIESDKSDDFDRLLVSSIGNLNLFDGHKVADIKGKSRHIPNTPRKLGVGLLRLL